MANESVSAWIANLKSGEADAAQKIWTRYAERLVSLARKRLSTSNRTAADEEDVAQSVFESICRGATAGRFAGVTNRDELWWLLLTLTKRKAIDHKRREGAQKRGGGTVRHESYFETDRNPRAGFKLDNLVGDYPTPYEIAILEERSRYLLSILRDDELREIANQRIEGYTVNEIADRLHLGVRAVERKLRLIRDTWASEL